MSSSRKVMLYSAVSLDGFIARKDGSIDWLDAFSPAPDGGDYGYSDLIGSIDTTLMGMKTFEFVLTVPGAFPYKGYRNYVFTRNAAKHAHPDVTFVSQDIEGMVRKVLAEKGKNIWLVGGGQMNGELLKAGLIDEMVLSYMPIVLGTGIPLFASATRETNFSLAKCHSWPNGVVQMRLQQKT